MRSLLHFFRNTESDTEESNTIDSEDEVELAQNQSNLTEEDFSTVQALFLHFVPPELAKAILDAAQYWPCISAKNVQYTGVLAEVANGNNAAAYYLVTPVIPTKHPHLKVEMVKFNIASCDQGWGGDANNCGTYNGSYTWFEAGIRRGVSDVSVPPIMLVNRVDDFDADAFNGGSAKEIVNSLERDRRWKLQYNMQVSSTVREHEVIWTKHDIIDDAAEASARARGAGTGRGFVSTLAPGDRIVIVGRAQYPGWKNNIHAARIEVFYS
ncbi:hypothetical protein E4T56_gene15843, partial [Termitomyces sp. T112]